MKAVVMAGGEGSRLRPLTSQRPKPLVPVAGRPIMEHILLLLRRHGIEEVIATVQYLGASIRNHFGDGSDFGLSLTYSVEDSPLGTAGSVKLAQDQLTGTFLVISGDALTDIDLGAAIDFHRERGSMATIVLKSVPNPLEYGVVVVDEAGAVQRFLEKPSWGEVISDLANTGIYILEPEVFEFFEGGRPVDWAGEVFPRLLHEGRPIFGYVADGYWEDVGNHASYLKANFDALQGRVVLDIAAPEVAPGVWVAEEADVSPEARIDGPAFIGPGSRIRPGAWLNGACVIGAYSTVDVGSKISNSVLWDHAYIGENCRLRGSVVCRAATIKNGSLLEEGSVIGSEVVVGAGAVVHANVRIWPDKQIEAGAVVNESVIWAGSWKRGLFTSFGLTGLTNVEFTPEFTARLGAAIGAMYPKGHTVAISRDPSRAAQMIKRSMIPGLFSSGADIADLPTVTIPVTRHHARTRHLPAIHVQTSPLDSRAVDIRIFDTDGLDIDKRTERKLENIFFREDIRRVLHYELGQISYVGDRAVDRYTDDLLARVDLAAVRPAKFKVLVDYNNGPAAQVLPHILRELNCTVIPLNASIEERTVEDPRSFGERREEMARIVKTVSANVGLLIDVPGERCFLIDETGGILDHETGFAVLAQLQLRSRGGQLVGPASSSLVFSMIADQLGSRFVPTKITPGEVLRTAASSDVALASDGAGGYCWPEFGPAFDAVFTAAKMLELMAVSGLRLSELCERVPSVGYTQQTEFCPWDVKGRVMRTVMERHLNDRVDLTDGVKVFVDGGWVLVVPDADRPEYHIIASSTDPKMAPELVEEHAALVRDAVHEARPEAPALVEWQ